MPPEQKAISIQLESPNMQTPSKAFGKTLNFEKDFIDFLFSLIFFASQTLFSGL